MVSQHKQWCLAGMHSLDRRHSPRIDIEVWVAALPLAVPRVSMPWRCSHLDTRDGKTRSLEQQTGAGGNNTLANTGDNAWRNVSDAPRRIFVTAAGGAEGPNRGIGACD